MQMKLLSGLQTSNGSRSQGGDLGADSDSEVEGLVERLLVDLELLGDASGTGGVVVVIGRRQAVVQKLSDGLIGRRMGHEQRIPKEPCPDERWQLINVADLAGIVLADIVVVHAS